ncbi:MAG: methyl-accepting chemotaxis protein [Hyphomicrobiales bacterium]
MSLNSLAIRTRLYIIGAVVVVGFLVLAAIGWVEGEKVKTAMHEATGLRAQIAEVAEMRLAGLELVLAAMDSIIDRDEGAIQPERLEIIANAISTVRGGLPSARAIAELTGKTPLLADFDKDFAEVVRAIEIDLKDLIERHAPIDEFAALDDAIDGGGERAMAALADIATAGGGALGNRLTDAEAAAAASETIQIAVALVLLLVLGALIVLIGQSITGVLTRLTIAMQRLARGETDIDVADAGRQDEIGAMAATLVVFRDNTIERRRLETESERVTAARARRQERLEGLIEGFRSRVEETLASVAAQTAEMRSTAESLSRIATGATNEASSAAAVSGETSSNVQTVAAAAEELSASIEEIAVQVGKTADVVGHARGAAKATSGKVAGLAAAGERIGNVVSLIQDIAEQTNLLALNATIEAARAGEMGKGFAVVASEVKTLANQTAHATGEISSQIAEVQESTSAVVAAIAEITRIMDEVDGYTSAIASAMEEQGSATIEISRNVSEAASGSRHVAGAMGGVSSAIGETSQSAAMVRQASEDVSRRTSDLKGEVERFLSEVAAA